MNIGTCELLDGSGAISMKQDIEKRQTRPLLEVSADLSSIYIYIYIYIYVYGYAIEHITVACRS